MQTCWRANTFYPGAMSRVMKCYGEVLAALRDVQDVLRQKRADEAFKARNAARSALNRERSPELKLALREAEDALTEASEPTAEAHARLLAVQALQTDEMGAQVQDAYDAAMRTGDSTRYERALQRYDAFQKDVVKALDDLVIMSGKAAHWAPRPPPRPERGPNALRGAFCGKDYVRAKIALLDAAKLRAAIADAKYALADATTRLDMALRCSGRKGLRDYSPLDADGRPIDTFLSAKNSLDMFLSADASLPNPDRIESLLARAAAFAACAPLGTFKAPEYLEAYARHMPELALVAETVSRMRAFLPIPDVPSTAPWPLQDVFGAVAGLFMDIWPATKPAAMPRVVALLEEDASTPTACIETSGRNADELSRLLMAFRMAYGAMTTEAESLGVSDSLEVASAMAAAAAALDRAKERVNDATLLNMMYAARAKAVMDVMSEGTSRTPTERYASFLEKVGARSHRSKVQEAFLAVLAAPASGELKGGGPLGGPDPVLTGLNFRVLGAAKAQTFYDQVVVVATFLNDQFGKVYDRWCSLGPKLVVPFPIAMRTQVPEYKGTVELRVMMYESPGAIAKTREAEVADMRDTLADLKAGIADAVKRYDAIKPKAKWSQELQDAMEDAELRTRWELQAQAAEERERAELVSMLKDAPGAHFVYDLVKKRGLV